MRKIYKVSIWKIEITEIEIIKETEHTIWYKIKLSNESLHEISERKNTSENKHFDTYNEAYEYLVDMCKRKVSNCNEMLTMSFNDLEKALSLQKLN